MEWGQPLFVIAIVAVSIGGWLVNNWIRARHGYPLEDEWGGKTARPQDDQTIAKLREENRALRENVVEFSDRVKVLERIVTDRGYDVATQIEALRDARKTGALLDSRETEERS